MLAASGTSAGKTKKKLVNVTLIICEEINYICKVIA